MNIMEMLDRDRNMDINCNNIYEYTRTMLIAQLTQLS